MSSNLVIVAVPDENDRVWKVSSEKVPHLTVLFLGDANEVSNLESIVEFVEHAANTTLRRFYLPVDRRGELGDDPDKGPADVLFFKKGRYDYKAIRDFRAALLQDNNIKTAYDSAQQFDGPWVPHLTLGYPQSTPANEIPDDMISSFYDVSFNKIALWTGDFEGPEFLLKDYWDEFEALESVPMDIAMSSLAHATKVSDTPWSQFKDSDYTDEQYARACLLDRGEEAGEGKQRYGLPVREPNGVLNRNACHAAAAVLSSKGGTGSARGNKIKATDEQLAKAKQKLIALYKGPLDEEVPEGLDSMDDMAQTIELGAEFLLHYGVKGMHWGTRKESPTAVTPKATSKVPHGAKRKTKIEVEGGENHPAHEDAIKVAQAQAKLKKSGAAALSNNELREVANRLQLEQQVSQLSGNSSRVGRGRAFVRKITGFNKDVNDTVNTGIQTHRLAKQFR